MSRPFLEAYRANVVGRFRRGAGLRLPRRGGVGGGRGVCLDGVVGKGGDFSNFPILRSLGDTRPRLTPLCFLSYYL